MFGLWLFSLLLKCCCCYSVKEHGLGWKGGAAEEVRVYLCLGCTTNTAQNGSVYVYVHSTLCSLGLTLSRPISPQIYVPSVQSMSLGPTLLQPCVPLDRCSHIPLFPWPDVPTSLCSPGSMFPHPCVPLARCSHIPVFPWPDVPISVCYLG